MKKAIRCAIYTRKSSEEGLEQSFNSLEAQREASVAYILSQKHEGWTAVMEHYDDGGFSGGTMERPALQRLLNDVSAGKIETIIVYKVDRLTRSLSDFAKIIEVFDSNKVSFVSVTQQFNTTTSMGRLTLNVLLSFAQFERELTGERIRTNSKDRRVGRLAGTPSLLTGILRETNGVRFTPTRALKNGKRYRYYTSQAVLRHQNNPPKIARYPAGEIEDLVTSEVRRLLGSIDKYLIETEATSEIEIAKDRAQAMAAAWSNSDTSKQTSFVRSIVKAVTVGQENLWIEIDILGLLTALLGHNPTTFANQDKNKNATIKLTVDFQSVRKGSGLRIYMPTNPTSERNASPSLIKALARAHDWHRQLVTGEVSTVDEVAKRTALNATYVMKILRCALLSPKLVEAILTGRIADHFTLTQILKNKVTNWRQQEQIFLSEHY